MDGPGFPGWTVTIDGLVTTPLTLDVRALAAQLNMETRFYRHRCEQCPWRLRASFLMAEQLVSHSSSPFSLRRGDLGDCGAVGRVPTTEATELGRSATIRHLRAFPIWRVSFGWYRAWRGAPGLSDHEN